MGTHNRVFAIGSARHPRCYFEIIAIDPAAPAPGRRRWFDLDDRALQARLDQGPALVHWVARCADVRGACQSLRDLGVDRGEVIEAERDTPSGRLRWQIAVRTDGQRLFVGRTADAHPMGCRSIQTDSLASQWRLARFSWHCERPAAVRSLGSASRICGDPPRHDTGSARCHLWTRRRGRVTLAATGSDPLS